MNKYKKLAQNTMIFAIGSFGSKILVLFLTRLYTGNFDYSDSGVKGLLETTVFLLQPVFTFALQEYLIRFGLDRNYNKKEVFTTSSVMTIFGMLIMSFTIPLLSNIPAFDFIKGYTILLIVYITTSSLRMLFQQIVRAKEFVKLFSFDGILTTFTFFIFNVVFISGFHWGVKGFMLAVILSDFLSSAFLFIAAGLYKYMGLAYFNKSLCNEMMRFAAPLIPTIVMWAITSLSDKLFIRQMHSDRVQLGEDAVGIYGYATQIPNLISVISTIFFQAWNMSAITENESADRGKFYEKVYSAYEAVLFIASAGLLLFIKPVTAIFIDTSRYAGYGDVYIYTPLLVPAVLFSCLNQFLGSIYSVTKHSKNSFWTALAACLVNLLLNFFLIPEWGIQGAAVATLFSYLFCYWLRIIDARYYVPFKFNGVKCFVNTVLLIVMGLITIAEPKAYLVWTILITALITAGNFGPLLETVRKVLKR